MEAAIEERNPDRSPMYADIAHSEDDEEPWKGYSAEVRTNDGEEVFVSLGYEERDDLIKDLAAVGITDVSDF